ILILVVIALAAVSYWALKHRRESRLANEERLSTEAKTVVTSPPPKAPAALPQTSTAPVAPEPGQPARLLLSIEVSEPSVVVLEADGETVINDELRRGYHRTIEAKERFRFRTIGNAAGIVLTLNDKPVPPLGRGGQVLHDVVFDRESLQKTQQ
ncbi:MAG TPA: DUF4115 domain-containing protein, partial [Thermoanaerobaculia bacterium]|nr:DUF4115 domain-containing protein [Thermoanaerobaculia bacterium]